MANSPESGSTHLLSRREVLLGMGALAVVAKREDIINTGQGIVDKIQSVRAENEREEVKTIGVFHGTIQFTYSGYNQIELNFRRKPLMEPKYIFDLDPENHFVDSTVINKLRITDDFSIENPLIVEGDNPEVLDENGTPERSTGRWIVLPDFIKHEKWHSGPSTGPYETKILDAFVNLGDSTADVVQVLDGQLILKDESGEIINPDYGKPFHENELSFYSEEFSSVV